MFPYGSLAPHFNQVFLHSPGSANGTQRKWCRPSPQHRSSQSTTGGGRTLDTVQKERWLRNGQRGKSLESINGETSYWTSQGEEHW